MRTQLTDLVVRNAKPPEKGSATVWDTNLPGLCLRISYAGTRSFCLVKGKERSRKNLGKFPTVSLAQARAKAREILNSGETVLALSFCTARDQFIEQHTGRDSTKKELKRQLTKHVNAIESKALADNRPAQIDGIIDSLRDRPSECLHFWKAVRAFFRWTVRRISPETRQSDSRLVSTQRVFEYVRLYEKPVRVEEGFLSETIFAICSLVVTISVPFAVIALNRYLDRQTLQVSITVNDAPLPSALRSELSKQRFEKYSVSLNQEVLLPTPLTIRQLSVLDRSNGYMRLSILNPSRKKMTGLTVRLKGPHIFISDYLYQLDDEEALRDPSESKISLGDLQPHQSRTVHFWTNISYVDATTDYVAALFDVTADEYQKRPIKVPMQKIVKHKLGQLAAKYMTIVSFVLLVIQIIYWSVLYRFLHPL